MTEQRSINEICADFHAGNADADPYDEIAALVAEVERLRPMVEDTEGVILRKQEDVDELDAEVRSLRGVVQAVEAGIRALHKNTGLSNGLGYVCDECEGNWSSGAGSVPPGCPTIRALDAALAAAADAPQRQGRNEREAASDVSFSAPNETPGPSPAVLPETLK